MKSYQTFMFSAYEMFTTFVLLFLEYLISNLGNALSLWALFNANTNPRKPCVSHNLEVGIAFLILSYSKTKGQKCLSCSAISHSHAVFF